MFQPDDPRAWHIVDLSLTFAPGMRGVALEPAKTVAQHGAKTTTLHLYSHAGTHLDAPAHSLDGALAVDQIDLGRCVGPALVINLAHKAPDSLITRDDLAPYADRIGPGARLLLRTDWDLHAALPDYRIRFPRLSLELAKWLAALPIALVGVETPSVSSLANRAEMAEVHQTLLRAQIVIVESLANLRELRQEVVQFVALPLKIAGCDGSPVRAIAIEETGMI